MSNKISKEEMKREIECVDKTIEKLSEELNAIQKKIDIQVKAKKMLEDSIEDKIRFEALDVSGEIVGVTDNGLIYSFKKKTILNKKPNCKMYEYATIQGYTYCVHRLVAECYVPTDGNMRELVVNHLDLNPLNNHYTNLEWCTSAENISHAATNHAAGKRVAYCRGKTNRIIRRFYNIADACYFLGIDEKELRKWRTGKTKVCKDGEYEIINLDKYHGKHKKFVESIERQLPITVVDREINHLGKHKRKYVNNKYVLERG